MSNDILRIGRDPNMDGRKTYMDTHTSELGIITLPAPIYNGFEDQVREYTQRYMADLSKMFKDLNDVSMAMQKVQLDFGNSAELTKNLNGLWYDQSKIMYYIQHTYQLLGSSTVPSMLLPKSIVNPDSKVFLVDPSSGSAIPANLHMYNQDAYFYHIGGLGFNTYLYIDGKMDGV